MCHTRHYQQKKSFVFTAIYFHHHNKVDVDLFIFHLFAIRMFLSYHIYKYNWIICNTYVNEEYHKALVALT
jgi:hypothetical protein